jgi:hypothetical protein
MDVVEPMCTKSRMDAPELSLLMPYTLKLDPNLAKLLRDNAEPLPTQSTTLMHDASRRIPYNEIVLPMRPIDLNENAEPR